MLSMNDVTKIYRTESIETHALEHLLELRGLHDLRVGQILETSQVRLHLAQRVEDRQHGVVVGLDAGVAAEAAHQHRRLARIDRLAGVAANLYSVRNVHHASLCGEKSRAAPGTLYS